MCIKKGKLFPHRWHFIIIVVFSTRMCQWTPPMRTKILLPNSFCLNHDKKAKNSNRIEAYTLETVRIRLFRFE